MTTNEILTQIEERAAYQLTRPTEIYMDDSLLVVLRDTHRLCAAVRYLKQEVDNQIHARVDTSMGYSIVVEDHLNNILTGKEVETLAPQSMNINVAEESQNISSTAPSTGASNPAADVQSEGEPEFDGYGMYPNDISILLDRLGGEFPELIPELNTAIMDQCKTIMRENKAEWERSGCRSPAASGDPDDLSRAYTDWTAKDQEELEAVVKSIEYDTKEKPDSKGTVMAEKTRAEHQALKRPTQAAVEAAQSWVGIEGNYYKSLAKLIQSAIDQHTAPLREENESLKGKLERHQVTKDKFKEAIEIGAQLREQNERLKKELDDYDSEAALRRILPIEIAHGEALDMVAQSQQREIKLREENDRLKAVNVIAVDKLDQRIRTQDFYLHERTLLYTELEQMRAKHPEDSCSDAFPNLKAENDQLRLDLEQWKREAFELQEERKQLHEESEQKDVLMHDMKFATRLAEERIRGLELELSDLKSKGSA